MLVGVVMVVYGGVVVVVVGVECCAVILAVVAVVVGDGFVFDRKYIVYITSQKDYNMFEI